MKKIAFILLLISSQVSMGQNEYMLAENYYRDGAYEKAIQLYKNLYTANPNNSLYLKRLVTCYQETSHFNNAAEILTNHLQKNPTQLYLNVELGYNLERQQQKEKAAVFYQKALLSIKKNPVYGVYIATLFKNNNLLDYAITAYQETMKYRPKSNYNFQIAQLYGEKGAFKKMFQAYIDLLDTNEQYLNSIQQFIANYLTDDSQNPNNILLKKIVIKKSMSNPKNSWNELLSWLFIKQKEYDKAFIQEQALFRRNPDRLSVILSLGNIAFQNQEYAVTKKCVDFVLKNTSFLAYQLKANEYLVKIALATKQPDIEILFNAIFKTYGKSANTLPIQLLYADYLTFYKNTPQLAINILSDALAIATSIYSKASIQLKLGDVYVFLGKYNKALIEFSRVQHKIKNHPLAQEARYKVAQTSYFKGDFKWAMAQLKVLKSAASQLIANDALALFLVISNNQPNDSLRTGLTKYAQADLLAYQQKNNQAIDSLQRLILKFKGQPIEDDALYKQANLFEKTNQFNKAIANYLNIIAIDKNGIFSDDSIYRLATIYQHQLKNKEKALAYYQQIIFNYPSSIYLVAARKNYRKLRGDKIQ